MRKQAGIPVGPGRGSAAGSMVTYTLYITEIDPMKYGLFFERFLNPERVTMPDIDMDFGDTRRGEVVDYVRRKYGDDHVAQIVTFGTMAARGAIRDVGRALNFTYAETDVVAKLVPGTPHITLDEALKVSPQLREMYEGDERVQNLIDTARALEGMPRNTSTHAAGVVITRLPVYDYVPLATNDDTIVTEYTMTTLEELGLLKMDFLGLRNITVIDDAIQEIRKTDPDFSMARVTDNDPKVMDMLTQGKNIWRVPDGIDRHDGRLRGAEAAVDRRSLHHRRGLPARPDGLDPAAHCLQKRPEARQIQAPVARSRFCLSPTAASSIRSRSLKFSASSAAIRSGRRTWCAAR